MSIRIVPSRAQRGSVGRSDLEVTGLAEQRVELGCGAREVPAEALGSLVARLVMDVAHRRREVAVRVAAGDVAIREVQEAEANDGGERLDIGVEERTLWVGPARRR